MNQNETLNTNNEAAPCSSHCYAIGGGWGDRIEWSDMKQFDDMTTRTEFECRGWKQNKPKVGDTIKAEFVKSWITFQFVEVQDAVGVSDMFFATVVPIKQEMKST